MGRTDKPMSIPVKLVDDREVQLDPRTASLGGSFWYDPPQVYSPLPLKWAFEQLSRYPKATLLDVDASTGCYTLLSALHPDLTVHSFEPVPLTNMILRENVYLNNLLDKVTINSCAVSNYSGTGVMHVVKADGGKGISMFDGKPAYHKDCEDIPMPVITLDDYCAEHDIIPTLIKVDTEGGELMVLEGARKTIIKHHPFIICEYSAENADQYGYIPSRIVEFVEEFGYVWSNPEQTDLLCVAKNWEELVK